VELVSTPSTTCATNVPLVARIVMVTHVRNARQDTHCFKSTQDTACARGQAVHKDMSWNSICIMASKNVRK